MAAGDVRVGDSVTYITTVGGETTFANIFTLNARIRLRTYTTAQRDSLSALANGDVIYNSTTGTVQAYVAGAWASL